MANLGVDLKQVPLFSSLPQRQLKRLSRNFKQRRFEPGRTPVREGHMSGIGFFVITDGEASVSVDSREVTRLGPGDYFGELGLISERARTATVTAETSLHCLELPVWDFRRFVKDNPDVSWKLLQHLVDLLLEAQERERTGTASPDEMGATSVGAS